MAHRCNTKSILLPRMTHGFFVLDSSYRYAFPLFPLLFIYIYIHFISFNADKINRHGQMLLEHGKRVAVQMIQVVLRYDGDNPRTWLVYSLIILSPSLPLALSILSADPFLFTPIILPYFMMQFHCHMDFHDGDSTCLEVISLISFVVVSFCILLYIPIIPVLL